jgi:hypothetical protein
LAIQTQASTIRPNVDAIDRLNGRNLDLRPDLRVADQKWAVLWLDPYNISRA